MSWNPFLHAHYVRSRILQTMEDSRAARYSAERAHAETVALREELAQSGERVRATEAILAKIEAAQGVILLGQSELQTKLDDTERELQRQGRVLELLYERESENVLALRHLRQSSSYEEAFAESNPLVTVIIPTYLKHEMLVTRALPSVLAQTYPHIEVVVVGDGAPDQTRRAIERLGDARVRYENLTVRAPYPEDPTEFWRVAGTPPWNAAWELAKGSWIAPLNDDDSFRPDHIELLLAAAQHKRCEVAYGAIEHHHPSGTSQVVNSWPPESHRFGWQAAVVHAGLSFMSMQLGSGALGVPGDWSLCRRMRRAGVHFTMIDRPVVDYYPSTLWDQEYSTDVD